MFRFISMMLLLFISYGFQLTSELKPLNNVTTLSMMNKLPNPLVPTPYIFLIYVLLLPLLIMWIIHFWKTQATLPRKLSTLRATLFYALLLLSIACNVLWHYELFIYMMITFVLLLLVNVGLYFTYDQEEVNFMTRKPIALLFGWHVFAFMFLASYFLTLMEWTGWGISQPLWSVIFLTITTAIGLHFLYHYQDFILNLALVWGFVHIAINNGFDSLFVMTASLFLTIAIVACYFIFKNLSERESQLN